MLNFINLINCKGVSAMQLTIVQIFIYEDKSFFFEKVRKVYLHVRLKST